MDTIQGRIKNYVFRNDDNGYSVARVITDEESLITIVGYLPKISEDVVYQFSGEWVVHQTYGKQLKIETFKKAEAQSLSGLISYLSSSFFTGIGPKTAEKIVTELGSDAIEQILNNPSVLKVVGLSPIRIKKLHDQIKENQIHEHILVTLYGYNISGKIAMKLIDRYDLQTIEKIEDNPYRLIDDIDGIGFLKADEIAHKLGIEKDDMRRIKAAILYTFEHVAYANGDIYLTEDELFKYTNQTLNISVDIQTGIDALVEENRVIIEEDRYYLSVSYHTEKAVAKKLIDINNEPLEDANIDYINTLIDAVELQKNIVYTEVQKDAIRQALTHKLTVITGGPGTGKTTIIDGLIEVYRLYHDLKDKGPMLYQKVALLAPTGRAAKRIKEILGLEASTIHRHLGYGYDGMFTSDESHPLPQELIVVDEASMIDLYLAHQLFQAVLPHTQVVIVGDVDQLPSVGPGQVLFDLIESKQIEVVRLNQIHRQAKDSQIITLARKVNEQNLDMVDLESINDVYLYHAYPNQIHQTIVKQVTGALHKGYSMIDDIQVLAPMYRGELGIDKLNQVLQQAFNPDPDISITYGDKIYAKGDKVIQLVNDPERAIMNGDIGVVTKVGKNVDNKEFLVVRFDDNEVMYLKEDLDELNLAYAVSIHKAQGSEYKIVMMPIVKPYMHMLKKELLYTAITRAKQYLIILGDMQLLVYAANHLQSKRKTTLALRLNDANDDNQDNPSDTDELSPYDFM